MNDKDRSTIQDDTCTQYGTAGGLASKWGLGTRRSGVVGPAATAAPTGRVGYGHHYPPPNQYHHQQHGGDVWSTKATGLRDVEDR